MGPNVTNVGTEVAAAVLKEAADELRGRSNRSMFNHANVHLPAPVDRILRWIVVTPDMHRVHHSVEPGETNSNFGFNAPWWDRLFGTYRAQPAAGHESMTIGLSHFRDAHDQQLVALLVQPARDQS
jgi:sterol desaturase/sphingolipid hydroxylase (fatty acid hydroxylase superfamily)